MWTADTDGANPLRLTSDLGVESNPTFSPDGSLLAFSAAYDGSTDISTSPGGRRNPDAADDPPGG